MQGEPRSGCRESAFVVFFGQNNNIRSGKRCSVEQIPQRQHRDGEVNPAQAASPTEALGDSCCGLLRGAVQLDLRCTLGPLELTFDLCPGCRPRDATVSPSGWTRAEGLWSPRELRMSNQHELEQTITVPIRRRVALSLATSPHRNTQHSLHPWSPPPRAAFHLYLSQHARG